MLLLSKVGQSSPNPKNTEEQKNSLGQLIYQKCVTVVVQRKLRDTRTHARTHARTHTHGANYNLPPASRAGDCNKFYCNLTFCKLNTYLILTNAYLVLWRQNAATNKNI